MGLTIDDGAGYWHFTNKILAASCNDIEQILTFTLNMVSIIKEINQR